ncbi:MAG: hypothetical protein AB7D92_08500 [Sphaerochaeta sp.]
MPFPTWIRGFLAQPNYLISSFLPFRLAFVRENVDGVLAIAACTMKEFFKNATLLFLTRSLIRLAVFPSSPRISFHALSTP